jgi:hypothetical protein
MVRLDIQLFYFTLTKRGDIADEAFKKNRVGF